MTTKLPEGVPVYIKEDLGQNCSWVYQDTRLEPNGTAMTYADRLGRERAIARAAFIRGRCRSGHQSQMDWDYPTADDYLNSEEFKKLVGEK